MFHSFTVERTLCLNLLVLCVKLSVRYDVLIIDTLDSVSCCQPLKDERIVFEVQLENAILKSRCE